MIVFVVVFVSIAYRRWRLIKGMSASLVLPVAARLQMPVHVIVVFVFVTVFVFVVVFVVVFLSIASPSWRLIKGTSASKILPVAARLEIPMHMILVFFQICICICVLKYLYLYLYL